MNEEAFKKLASYTLVLSNRIKKLEKENLEIKHAILRNMQFGSESEKDSLKFLLFRK